MKEIKLNIPEGKDLQEKAITALKEISENQNKQVSDEREVDVEMPKALQSIVPGEESKIAQGPLTQDVEMTVTT